MQDAGPSRLIRTADLVDTSGMIVTTERIELLTRLLNAASMRHDVIAQNVANVNTPGYQTLELSFEKMLEETLASGSPITPTPQVVTGTGGIERDDGNNVDIDLEVARLQKNSLYFKVYTQLLATELAQYRSAIAGR
jgi:flagellar basal-body rod protein FlgB